MDNDSADCHSKTPRYAGRCLLSLCQLEQFEEIVAGGLRQFSERNLAKIRDKLGDVANKGRLILPPRCGTGAR